MAAFARVGGGNDNWVVPWPVMSLLSLAWGPVTRAHGVEDEYPQLSAQP
jgi:hypothetical protein